MLFPRQDSIVILFGRQPVLLLLRRQLMLLLFRRQPVLKTARRPAAESGPVSRQRRRLLNFHSLLYSYRRTTKNHRNLNTTKAASKSMTLNGNHRPKRRRKKKARKQIQNPPVQHQTLASCYGSKQNPFNPELNKLFQYTRVYVQCPVLMPTSRKPKAGDNLFG